MNVNLTLHVKQRCWNYWQLEMVFIMLPDSLRQEIEVTITDEIRITRENICQLKKLLEPVSPDNAIGRLSRMDALEMLSVNQLKLDRQNIRLSQLGKAMKRLDGNPDFGVCQECGESIPRERLILRPESEYCVFCQQAVVDNR